VKLLQKGKSKAELLLHVTVKMGENIAEINGRGGKYSMNSFIIHVTTVVNNY
jgi:hypothetical protein